MRILWLTNVFPNPLSSTKGTFNFSLANALAQQHQVHVICPISWTDRLWAFVRRRSGARRKPQNMDDSLKMSFPTYYYPPKICRSQYGRFLDWSIRDLVDEALRQFQPDAIVSYWVHPDGEVALRAARRAGIPCITMAGGSDILLLAREGSRRRAVLNVLRETDAVVTVSEHLADCIREDGIAAEKLHVIRRGVNREVFKPGDRSAARARLGIPADRKVLVAVGRLVPVKGFSVLIDTCRRLVDRGVPVACYILGEGPLEGELAAQIRRLKLENHVTLGGPQPQHVLADWYRAADLAVLTSLSEGVPNVLLEAMACGVPFVASNVGGIPEIADPRAHRLVPPQDHAALTEAIIAQLQQTPDLDHLQFEPQSWAQSAEKLVEVIRGCCTNLAVELTAPVERHSQPKEYAR